MWHFFVILGVLIVCRMVCCGWLLSECALDMTFESLCWKWRTAHEFWHHFFKITCSTRLLLSVTEYSKRYTIYNIRNYFIWSRTPKKKRFPTQTPNLTMHACNYEIFTYAAYKSYCLMLCRFFSIWTFRRQFDWKYFILICFFNKHLSITYCEWEKNLKLSFKLNWIFYSVLSYFFLEQFYFLFEW